MGTAKMGNKRVGVFMKVYRNEPTMHDAIKSVLGQTYHNLKYYILVSEVTKPIILEYAEKDERIEIITGGLNDGFRTYMKYIAEENAYVTTIDADDWYDKTYIEYLLGVAEEKEVDIVACGNYYFTGKNKIVAERKQNTIIWEAKKTNQVLPFIYGHFRTIWGKLFKAQVLLACDLESLPKYKQYGGYGGDTIFTFSLFLYAKMLCVCDKTLYYYRMSETSSTYKLSEGRLESDEVLFCFVEQVLKQIGVVGDNQRRYLLWIYGNALIDTIKLLLQTQISESERAEKLLYIFEKSLTKELFFREATGALAIPELGANKSYAFEVYQWMTSDNCRISLISGGVETYLKILEIIYPGIKGFLSADEFGLLLKSKKILDAYVTGKNQQVLEMLAVIFKVLKEDEAKCCLKLMRRLTSDAILKSVLQDEDFVRNYIEIIKLLNYGKYEETSTIIKNYFSKNTFPNMAEPLVVLWNNLSAQLENVSEFIFSKQLKVEILALLDKKEKARIEYEELVQLGIEDDTMEYLKQILYAGV